MGHLQHSRTTETKIASLLLSIMFVMVPRLASAFIDPPVLIPSNPVAGEQIAVSIHYGYCDAFLTTAPQITQNGNAIHMLLETLHFDDPLWCQSPPSVTMIFPVGSFPAGDYTLQVERFYDSAVPAPVYETLANFDFVVRGQASVALPTSGLIGYLLLIVSLIVAATLGLDARRRCGLFLMFAFVVSPVGAR